MRKVKLIRMQPYDTRLIAHYGVHKRVVLYDLIYVYRHLIEGYNVFKIDFCKKRRR